MKYENDLTTGNVARQLVKYAVPLVLSSLLQSVYSITDMVIAGHFIGGQGLSAINNAALVMNLITQIALGLTVGGNVLIGRLYGSGEHETRKTAAGTLFTVCLLLGVFCALLVSVCSGSIMFALHAPALSEATGYLRVCAIGLLPIFGYNALSAVFRAMGDSRRPLMVVACTSSANVVLDILFVAVLHRGVLGAAVATVLSQVLAFLISLAYVFRDKEELGICRKYLHPDADATKKIFQLGIPIALQWTIASISWLAVSFLINRYGVDPSAGNGVSARIKDFCQLFITAMTSAAATMIAQNLGAKGYGRAEDVMRTCMKITLGIAVVMILTVQLFAPSLAAVFTSQREVQHWAVLNLRIEIFAQIFYAGFLTYNTLATGCGDTVFVMWNSFVNCIVVRFVLAIILDRFLGIIGVYLA